MDQYLLVSVCIAVYNREKFIKNAIESVLKQTYQNFEIIIINDGSTDGSLEVINDFDDKRIKVFSNESNKGVTYTRNRYLEKASGELIAVLDSDDEWLNMKLEKQSLIYVDRNIENRLDFEITLNEVGIFGEIRSFRALEEVFENVSSKTQHSNVLIIDPSEGYGFKYVKNAKKKNLFDAIIAYAPLLLAPKVLELFGCGVSGYIIKDNDGYSSLINALKLLSRGGVPLSPPISKILVSQFNRNPNTPLTQRELQVLEKLSLGKTYRGLAVALGIGTETARHHVKNIYSKLNVNRKFEALEMARRERWI